MITYDQFETPPARLLERVRRQAFATLTPRTSTTTHLSLAPRVYPEGHVLRLVTREIVVPADSVLVFVDEMPEANFGHPCRYQFHSLRDGQVIAVEDAEFPPQVADPQVVLEHFHAPLTVEKARPIVYGAVDWSSLTVHPWHNDDNRFALLFTSQISNRRHVEDLEFAYRILRHRFGFPAGNIYVLCYDGTIGAVDATAAEMATWVGDGTAYQMTVDDSATTAHLQDTLDTLSGRMDSDSLLFVHTNNHGSTTGLCVDNSTVVTPSEWGTMLSGMSPFGTLVVTMEQCYSGAFSQPTIDNSRASRTSFASAVPATKVSAGAGHFDPWAQVWFEAVNGATAYGASLAHDPDTSGNGLVSVREAFTYSDTYDPAGIDDPQYADSPAGCGSSIYLTKAPSLWEIVAELLKHLKLIEKKIKKPPLPDPAPDWGSELLGSLALLESLSQRLDIQLPERREIRLPEPAAGKAPAGKAKPR